MLSKKPPRYSNINKLTERKTRYAALIPAYNEEENIISVLESILRQTIKPELVVLLDDHSSDGTFDRAARWLKSLAAEEVDRRIINDRGLAWSLGQKRLIVRYVLPRYGVEFILVRNLEHNVGKTWNLNWTVYNLVGNVPFILVVDGDTILEPEYAEKLLSVMLGDERIAAAYGWPIPRASTNGFLSRLTIPVRLYKWARRALIVRRFEDLISARYNLMGCALMYRASILKTIPRPTFGGSHDTFHAWLLQFRGYHIAMLPNAIVYLIYNHGELGFKYYIGERLRWSQGGYQAFLHLGYTLLKLRLFRLLSVALLALVVPVKYSLVLLSSIAMFVLGQPSFLIKLLIIDTIYYIISITLTIAMLRKIELNVRFKTIVLGALLHYLVFKWLEIVLTVYIVARTLWEKATGKWKHAWRLHKR